MNRASEFMVHLFMVIGWMMCYPDIINLFGGAGDGAKMKSF